VFTLATDIHDDVVSRDALAATQIRLDRFTENIPYPLTYVDRSFVLRFVNKAHAEATGTKPSDLLGRHIGQVRGARRWAEHEPYFERAMPGKTVQYTRLVSSLPNGPRWMRTSYVPDLDANGEVLGLYTVTIDVHELTVAQERLKAVGATLQGAVRAEDAVGRFGGDEFLVLARVRDADGADALALHMLTAVQSVTGSGRPTGVVSASIGYALAPSDAQHPLNLLQLADDAMYAAKRSGKNRAMHCAAISFEATR
jgi:PAS domain S-box-containing protein